VHFLELHPADLIVLATHQREGFDRWLHHAVAEPVAREAHAMTLFVPPHGPGFVSIENGEARIRRVLIPVDRTPSPHLAVHGAAAAAWALGASDVRFIVLHVGDEASAPEVGAPSVPGRPGWSWDTVVQSGEAVDGILQAARDVQADLIVMGTEGHVGFLDALRGSTTERVLRGAPCPLLAVPAQNRRVAALLQEA
jgi:nucleotide-binding universal stress UspA family protein